MSDIIESTSRMPSPEEIRAILAKARAERNAAFVRMISAGLAAIRNAVSGATGKLTGGWKHPTNAAKV